MKRNIIYAGISSLLCLLTLEVSIRILSDYSDRIRFLTFNEFDNFQLDQINNLDSLLRKAPANFKPYSNWGGFILNSKGLRTPEYQVNKPPNTIRVITIGDSFLSDSGPVPYPYHFTLLLEKELNAWIKNGTVELVNLGVPAVGPKFEQRMLEIEGLRLKPDLVIWGFFVGNDFIDEAPIGIENGDSIKEHIFVKSYLSRLIRNLYILYSYMRTQQAHNSDITRQGPSGTYIGSPDDYDPNKPFFEKSKFVKIQSDRMRIYKLETFPWNQWEKIQKTLTEVRDTCRFFKIPLLMVIIPDENQVNAKLLEEVVKHQGKRADDFQMDLPQTLLTEFFEKNKIDYLDLLPVFKKVGEEKSLYTLQDTHWNIDGNSLAAETIINYLLENGDSFNIVRGYHQDIKY